MIKGIIYDMDDLMVDSHPLHKRAAEKWLQKYGHTFSDLPKDFEPWTIGRRVIDIMERMMKDLGITGDLEKAYQERQEIFLKTVAEELQALPGLRESLSLFREEGYRMALASSGSKKYIDIVLDRFNIRDYFRAIVSGDDVKKGKPDPEPYLVATQKLELPASHCLVLEDAANGVASAKAAGCKCIAIRNPHTPPQDHSQADKSIDSLEEITVEMVKAL